MSILNEYPHKFLNENLQLCTGTNGFKSVRPVVKHLYLIVN